MTGGSRKIYWVQHDYEADLKVFFVKQEYEAKWNKGHPLQRRL